jgi:hypothetical protein
MRRRDILVGPAALLVLAAAPAATDQPRFDGPRSAVLPLQRAIDGKLYLAVTVMGRDLPLFLDTGASTVIDIGVARSLGLALVDTGQQGFGMTGLAGNRVSTRVDLRLGPIGIAGLAIDCLDLSQLRAISKGNGMPAFDGVIGAELLTMLKAQIDFVRPALTVTRPD